MLYELVVDVSGQRIRQRYSRRNFPRFVLNREFQPTCLAFMSPANKAGNTPPKKAVRSFPTSGWEGERYAAGIFNGLPANMTWMAVASR